MRLPETDLFLVVTAYFTIYGYELLADELDSVGRTRFLFGEPSSVNSLDRTRAIRWRLTSWTGN